MRGNVVLMLVVGLGLMGWFWWGAWEEDNQRTAEATPTRDCAATTAKPVTCVGEEPICFVDAKTPNGVCTQRCQLVSQCRRGWCCATHDDKQICLPPDTCPRNAPRAD